MEFSSSELRRAQPEEARGRIWREVAEEVGAGDAGGTGDVGPVVWLSETGVGLKGEGGQVGKPEDADLGAGGSDVNARRAGERKTI